MIEDIVICSLMNNKAFARKVLPHIQPEYYSNIEKKTVFNLIKDYVVQYRNIPSPNSLKLELTKNDKISESLFNGIVDVIDNISVDDSEYDIEWLIDNCESWCKERALHNAIIQSVEIIDEKGSTTAIPDLIRKALQVEFETSIGIEFFDDKGIADRWKEYHNENIKFSTGISSLDNVFAGGLEPKSLTVIMSGCVTKNAYITIRNKKTGLVQKITMLEFNKMLI